MNWQETRDFLTPCFPEAIRSELMLLQPGELREIRVRADRPTVFITATRTAQLPWSPGQHQLEALVEALSGHSLYARSEETGHGYLTLRGGHRMGLCGRVVHRKAGPVLADIASVCIRIAAEWPGCADPLLPLASQGSLLLIGSTVLCLVDAGFSGSPRQIGWLAAAVLWHGRFFDCGYA